MAWIFHRLDLRGLALCAGLAACGGAAQAQSSAPALKLAPYRAAAVAGPALPVKPVGDRTQPAPDLANPLDPLAPTASPASPIQSTVFARTAVDHRFAGKRDVTGSIGFLCGLQPGHGETDNAAAYGADPHGRFVGAKLSFAFR